MLISNLAPTRDIAIGASRLYGFRIMENFNFPIAAWNISEFWKRWHMTLVGWIQSYVYMPTIGLTRRPYVAVYCTFITMGLWHGDLELASLGALSWYDRFPLFDLGEDQTKPWVARLGQQSVEIRRYSYHLLLLSTCSYAFSTTSGGWMALRVFVKLLGINLGPRY